MDKSLLRRDNKQNLKSNIFFAHTRGIWEVLSMVFYLSNRFTNSIMFGIILRTILPLCNGTNFMSIL